MLLPFSLPTVTYAICDPPFACIVRIRAPRELCILRLTSDGAAASVLDLRIIRQPTGRRGLPRVGHRGKRIIAARRSAHEPHKFLINGHYSSSVYFLMRLAH